MKASDLEKQRSQFVFKCVKEVWEEYENAKNEYEELKRKEEIDCNKEENKEKQICKKLKVLKEKEKFAKNYKSYIKKIPMMILNNGLGTTFAFMYSKKKDGNAYEKMETQIKEWFGLEKNIVLVEWFIEMPTIEYRQKTDEILALFKWWRSL